MYQVVIPRDVSRQIERLPRAEASNVTRRILALGADPRPSWTKRLRGFRTFRFRVGDYRVLYDVDDETRTVTSATSRTGATSTATSDGSGT